MIPFDCILLQIQGSNHVQAYILAISLRSIKRPFKLSHFFDKLRFLYLPGWVMR